MAEETEKKMRKKEDHDDHIDLVRVKGTDLPGNKGTAVGLTKIKGFSWAFATALCKIVGIDPSKKVGQLSKEEISKIEDFMDKPEVPGFMKNRQKDFDDGEDLHLYGSDLKLKNEFDIKRLKKIKSYKGGRHSANLPVRGQRTKANFRRQRKRSGTGVKKK